MVLGTLSLVPEDDQPANNHVIGDQKLSGINSVIKIQFFERVFSSYSRDTPTHTHTHIYTHALGGKRENIYR